MRRSTVFGPTNTTADTKTQIGSTYQMIPGTFNIVAALVSFGGLTDAKAASAILHIEVGGTDGPFEYAYGSGSGGAATTNVALAEKIQTQIPVAGGSQVKVYATSAEVQTDCTVELQFEDGAKSAIRSYVTTIADLSADTLATKTLPAIVKAGSLIQLRIAAGNVVNAKASGIKFAMRVPGQAGPFEGVAFSSQGGATNSGIGKAEKRDFNIPVTANAVVYVDLTAAEAQKDAVVSIAVA